MSNASELNKLRKENGTEYADRSFEKGKSEERLDDYYAGILSNDGDEELKAEYAAVLEEVNRKFIEKTRIHPEDLPFLLFATFLHCLRFAVLNGIIDERTKKEKANKKGGREDKLHKREDDIFNKLGNGENPDSSELYASLDMIITARGVPYDATRYASAEIAKEKLFKGANHRFATLGHDPTLGLIFGTANILTNTISTNKKIIISTHRVTYTNNKDPKIDHAVSTIKMLKAAANRVENDKKAVVAAVVKQLIHIATDLYTPCGIQLPGAQLIFSNTVVERITKYIGTGDIIKVGAETGLAVLINIMIASVHGLILMPEDNENYNTELFRARTKKIVMYSNLIASTSNVIAKATVDPNKLSGVLKGAAKFDSCGFAVTLYRLFNDTKFICELEEEFINSNVSDVYEEKLSQTDDVYL